MIVNMSVISGYSMAGIPGAFAAACGLVFPAFITISIVTYFYVYLKSNLYVQRILNGVRSAVVPIILSAALKLKARSLISKKSWVLMIASFFVCAFTDFGKVLLILAGAVLATAGVMVPSLTLCLLAAIFFIRLKGNTVMERILRGVRPVSLGMLPAVALSLGQSSFVGEAGIAWDLIAIAVLCGYLLVKKNLSVPKTILLAAVLGLLI